MSEKESIYKTVKAIYSESYLLFERMMTMDRTDANSEAAYEDGLKLLEKYKEHNNTVSEMMAFITQQSDKANRGGIIK
ncbi:hypothetical protein [Parasporobacterium paucivorans]|uniref:Uncharacterized protein n=1 Tax=Parasporobacterium paucivorans DSM 15970 TaxID=1122934 RepID=A0A1M6B5N4_9FIRM|nr:hypothetical protein [Parasporobacterium paucivorans]SHI44026.1 hypothetical protein SAMN02745691_00266 [Parasporobacterium paucivorans DSM 15970]